MAARIGAGKKKKLLAEGVLVGVGLFVQAAHNGDAAIAGALCEVMQATNMPRPFAGVGIEMDVALREHLCTPLCATPYVPAGEDAHRRVNDALEVGLAP